MNGNKSLDVVNLFDVVTFGETMVMFNTDMPGPLRSATNFYKSLGGAESNLAIALSRLGCRAGWFSRLGDDEFGKAILNTVRGEGVDVSQVSFDPAHSTGIMFKERFQRKDPNVYYYRKDSAASHMAPDDINGEYIKSAGILHVTGITLAISETARAAVYRAIDLAKENGVTVSFDPNIRLRLWGREESCRVIMDVAKRADIIFPGDDEGYMLTGSKDPEDIAGAFLGMGCRTAVVKLGKDGCYAATKDGGFYAGCYPTELKEDSAGAGDGFDAGFLAGLIRGLPLRDCAAIGNFVGAMATLVRGDIEGYPDEKQLAAFLAGTAAVQR